MRLEQHPYNYNLRDRFPAMVRLQGFEGGAIYTAEQDGLFYLLIDEGTMADFLDPVEDADLFATMVKVYEFGSNSERQTFINNQGKRQR